VLLCLCCIVSYLGHIMPWCLFGLCAIVTLVFNWREWQRCVVAAAVMMPSVAMAVSAVLNERGEHTYIKDAPFVGTFRDFPTSVLEFPKRVMELFPGNFDAGVLFVISATLIGLFAWERFERGEARPDASHRLLITCIWVLGVTYLALPYAITKPMAWWYVAPRIPSLMVVLLSLVPAVRLTGLRRLVMLPVLICAVALPLKLAQLYRSFSVRNQAMMRLVDEVPRGAPTLLVVRNMMRGPGSEEKSGDPATSGPVYWHFSSWPMAINGGYSPYAFDQGIPIRPKKALKVPSWGSTDIFAFRQAPDFQYYIVRDAGEEMDREPSVRLEKRIGDWSLYKRVAHITDEP
jgi:uncharacterized membrane protein